MDRTAITANIRKYSGLMPQLGSPTITTSDNQKNALVDTAYTVKYMFTR
jgi:hypothetical protein